MAARPTQDNRRAVPTSAPTRRTPAPGATCAWPPASSPTTAHRWPPATAPCRLRSGWAATSGGAPTAGAGRGRCVARGVLAYHCEAVVAGDGSVLAALVLGF